MWSREYLGGENLIKKGVKMVKVKSYANIAIVKYWGKKDAEKMIPSTSSISLTLNDMFTETEMEFINDSDIKIAVEKEIKSEKAFLEAVDSGINGIDTVTKSLMELVAGNVTNDLYLSEMSVNLKEISLSGLGKTRLEIAQFEYNLRATRLFENIYIENIRYNEEQDAYEFNMKMSAKSEIYYKNDADDKKAGDR